MQNQDLDRAENMHRDYVPGAWREGVNLEDTRKVTGHNTANREGKKQRNLIRHLINSEVGSVPWQDRMV